MKLRFLANPELAHGEFAHVLEATHKASSRQRFDVDTGSSMDRPIVDVGPLYRERNRAVNDAFAARHEALFGLALLAEVNDDDCAAHIVRIGFLAEALALKLGQSRRWAKLLRLAAPMHDIGKICIPDAVLNAPGGFTLEERQAMNRHPGFGADILRKSNSPLFRLAADVALSHHERYDGLGYPHRLRGANIPLCARIVSVVDFFDALAKDRCDRAALSYDKIRQILRAERENAFDPAVVDCFLRDWSGFIELRERVTRRRPGFSELVGSPGDEPEHGEMQA